ncbi:MAG: oligosaccharide flippase family protein [Acidobacteriota bacterium]
MKTIVQSPSLDRRNAAWDVRHGSKNYAALVGAQIASGVLSFAAVWLATHLLGPTGYGGVVAIIAASQAIGQLGVNWTAVSLSRYGVEEFVETGHVAKAFWTRFWIFLPNVILILATSPLWLPWLVSLLKLPSQASPIVLSLFLASALWIHVQQALQGAKLMRLQASLLTFERLLVLLIILACALTGKASFLNLALAYILAPIGACLAGLWRLRNLIFPVVGIDRALLKRMLTFSLPILPASFVGYMSSNYLDAFFITHYLSGAHLGVYSVAYQLTGTGLQLPLLVGSVLLPLFVTLQVEGQFDRAERFMHNALPLLTLLWGTACALAAAVGSYFLPLIFGEQFSGLGALLWPLMAAAALAGPTLMGYAPFSNSKSVTYIAMLGAIASALVNVVLNYLLIPTFGLMGCAWATTAAYGVNTLVVVVLVHKRLLSGRPWTIQAVSPIVVGSMLASFYSVNLMALAVTLLLSVALMLLHRKSVSAGFKMLKNFQRGGSEAPSVAES